MSIENKLLRKVLETKDWDTIIERGITSKYFTGNNSRAFKWIADFKIEYGNLPEQETFKKHFPEVSLEEDAKESVSYYCDEVRKKVKQNKLVAVLDKATEQINNGKVEECYTDIGKLLLEVNTDFTFAEKVDVGTNTLQRFQDYETSKITGGMTGYPLGIKPIDKQTGGMKDIDLFTFLAPSGKGKALTLDTPVLTTDGWKNMGELTYGDQVFGRDGKPCNIIGIYPQGKKQVYRVTFADDTYVDCCKDHLWNYSTIHRANKGYSDYKVATTEELYNNSIAKLTTKEGYKNIFIPVCKPIEFSKKPLPLDPYVLGTELKTKFIPKEYLYADINSRRKLLAGLIDTDGNVNPKGATTYSTSSMQLAKDVQELGRGLGYRVYIRSRERNDATEYTVYFSTKDYLGTSQKHLEKYQATNCKSKKHFDRLYIKSIEKLDKFEEMQCIAVDSSDHTFICKDYIVTHNTWLLGIIAANLIRAGYKVLFLTKEMSPNQILKRMDAILAPVSYNRLKNGKLDKVEEETYKHYLETIAPRFENKLSIQLVLNGVNECIAKVDAFQPDVLLVDGGYLMSEGADPEDWKAVLSVWKAFKVMALSRKVPVIITSQLTDKGSIAYATSLKQYCDGIWVMKQDEVQRASKEISIETFKIRDGEHMPPFCMSWDFNEANTFGEVLYTAFNSETKQGFLVNNEENAPLSLKKIE